MSILLSVAKVSPVRFGTSARQLSLFSVSRKLALNRLPPDLVMTLTTPPPKRPYSAEMPALATVVSWTASSMTRFTDA